MTSIKIDRFKITLFLYNVICHTHTLEHLHEETSMAATARLIAVAITENEKDTAAKMSVVVLLISVLVVTSMVDVTSFSALAINEKYIPITCYNINKA